MARPLLSGALVTVMLGAVLSAGPLRADPAFASGTTTCRSSQLSTRLSADTHDNTQRYRFVVLTDIGGRCVLRGRPAVSLEHHGEAVAARGDYFPYSPTGRTPAVRTVTLAHGATASIWLAVAVAGQATCRRQPVDGFLLRLPRQHLEEVRLPARKQHRYAVCGGRSSHDLAFSQFLPGSGR